MTQTLETTARHDIAWQRFSVPYDFPVAFTRGLFSPDNTLFADVLARREADKRHRVLIYVDDGIAKALPGLLDDIRAYVGAHADRIELVGLETVPGGEKIKTELTWIEGIQDAIHAKGIDRHSYVVAIGGGAMLDARQG